MTARRDGSKPPAAGASRVYRLVPADVDDAFEVAAAWFRSRGWTVIERDYRIKVAGRSGARWLDVELWAIPPSKQPASAAGGGF
jgi:hypothetical protein